MAEQKTKLTHGEFAQAVMKEWGVSPMELCQSCLCQWYLYFIIVECTRKIVGKYTLVDSKPMFVLIKKDGTEEQTEVNE